MATLSRELRNALERAVIAARRQAEAGARKALSQLAVAHKDPWPTMTSDQQGLRRRLRARGRQLGDRLEDVGTQGVDHLVSECAYEQWHRMLFARFLAECGLLIEPTSGVSVSVDECKELAREQGVDWIWLASTFAQGMLPQIFRADDAVLEITLPAEHRQPLEQLLISLPLDVFLADDSLGWVYQFWQSEAKDRVNESEEKIGADQLPAVTQLFTEDYMVEFLLHNTLGAWWAGRRFPNGVEAGSEQEARTFAALPGFEWKYLRFVLDGDSRWVPAAGTFSTWPTSAREIRFLDPCMGSGHFLVAALPIFVAMRRTEEGMSIAEACASVIRENLFGLEIDPRCTQIGAFNLALGSWKLAGWQTLPSVNVACSGLALNAKREDWIRLAGSNENARVGMERLYDLFAQAPILGSLINPKSMYRDLLATGFEDLKPLLEKALQQERPDEVVHELAVTAQGVTQAAAILAGMFTAVITNVPYLGRGKQAEALKDYSERVHNRAKADLATCFVERCMAFCDAGGTSALVTPHNWLFMGTYEALRRELLRSNCWNFLVRLGPGAFETISGEVVNVVLVGITRKVSDQAHGFVGADVSSQDTAQNKAKAVSNSDLLLVRQQAQTTNPDARIMLESRSEGEAFAKYADSFIGFQTGDTPRFVSCFWEVQDNHGVWEWFQTTTDETSFFRGCDSILRWEGGHGEISTIGLVKGREAWTKLGVCVRLVGHLPCSLYFGHFYDQSSAALIPKSATDLPAIWAFCSSDAFKTQVRKVDQALKVTNATLTKISFDLPHWRQVAAEQYPQGLPKPHSDDPTQWLFSGHPVSSSEPLQVAMARLLGYRWPRQNEAAFPDSPSLGPDGLDPFAAQDGIVCLSAGKGQESAAARLGALLATAFGSEWSAAKLQQLLTQAGSASGTLEDWLVNGFFDAHCALFHHRPFIWHLWDGRRDGFNAFVNSHKLNRTNLEKLTYGYLGDWISRQQGAVLAGDAGSDARLVSALQLQEELKKILEGETPYDIFVRWKPLAHQPIGWEPDLNDGVRMNIRPFLMSADVGKKGAGILRIRPNIKWDKDRGKEPRRAMEEFPWLWGWDGKAKDFAGGSNWDGNRWNDLHYSREFKLAARRRKGLA